MQDHRQTGSLDPAAPLLFYWPGDEGVASGISQWLGATEAVFEPVTLASTLRLGRPAVVLWRGPEGRLGRCGTTGQAVSRALDDWKVEVRGLLVLFRQNRRRLILLDIAGLDQGGLGALASHLARPEPAHAIPAAAVSPLGRILGELAQQGDADLRQLLDELRAASLPCAEMPLLDSMEEAVAQAALAERSVAALTAQRQTDAEQTAGLAAQVAAQEAEIQALRETIARIDAAHSAEVALREAAQADLDLMRDQVTLAQETLTHQTQDLQGQLQAASLVVQTKDSLLAAQEASLAEVTTRLAAQSGELADLTATLDAERATLADLTATLAQREEEVDLLRTQIDLASSAAAQQDHHAASTDDVSRLQIKVLEERLTAQDLASADLARQLQARTRDHDQLQALVDQHRAEVAEKSALVVALRAEAAKPAAADPAELALLRNQLGLMQDLLATSAETASAAPPAAPQAATTADPAPRTEAWDKALAKALASARTEADQRARLERELNAMKAEAQSRTRRDEDQAHNRRLFAMMTSEANAALDEIARLSQGKKPAGAPRVPSPD